MDALHQADIGNVDFFKVAEDKDVLQVRNYLGESVLMRAAIGGHLECCKVILGKWPDLLYEQNNDGNTALIYAINYRKIECVKFLAAGAEQRLFRMGEFAIPSPLHRAITVVSLESVKILTEADPNFDSIPGNKDVETPQMLAVKLASTKTDSRDIRVQIKDWIIKKLEEKKAAPKGLGPVIGIEPDPIDRATKGDADFFRGAPVKECVESRDKNGNSVLSVSVLNGHFECSKVIFVRFPELLYLQNTNEKHTPLHHAVWRGIPLIVKLLVVGADKKLFKMQNISGSTPMHMAVWKKRLQIVKILTKAVPDYNQLPTDNNGETPLAIAQRLASGKANDDVEVKIRDLLLGKQSGTEITVEETTSDGNKLIPTALERELSIPLQYLHLYRRLVRQFGGIVPLKMDKLEVGPIGKALANFLVFVAEMQVQTPKTISEEKLEKWEDAYSFSAKRGLRISWFYDRIQWFRDWLDRRAKALYPVEDEVDRMKKQISDLQAVLNSFEAKLENTRSAYSKFDFKVIKD